MRILLVCIFLLAAVTGKSQDWNLFEKKEFIYQTGKILPYRILYPENYNRKKKYPVIMFLHGSGERGNDNEKQLIHGANLFLRDDIRKAFPAIVIFPQCPRESRWVTVNVDSSTRGIKMWFDYTNEPNWPLNAVYELLRTIVKQEAVQKQQLYITGLSMGGMGSFEMVYRFPNTFAAAVPICGGGDTLHYDSRVRKTAFRIFHGEADPVVPVEQSLWMINKLKKLNVHVEYKVYPDVGHDSWTNVFAEPDYISWMMQWKKRKVKM